jgi:hypothetical protein
MSETAGHFCLIASDCDGPEGKKSGYNIAIRRFDHGMWPFYERTRNRKLIRLGDRILVYVGGSGRCSHSIVASASVSDVLSPRKSGLTEPEYRIGITDVVLSSSNITRFVRPVLIRDILPSLDMCPRNLLKWGVVFMGGARMISVRDYNSILKSGTMIAESLNYIR